METVSGDITNLEPPIAFRGVDCWYKERSTDVSTFFRLVPNLPTQHITQVTTSSSALIAQLYYSYFSSFIQHGSIQAFRYTHFCYCFRLSSCCSAHPGQEPVQEFVSIGSTHLRILYSNLLLNSFLLPGCKYIFIPVSFYLVMIYSSLYRDSGKADPAPVPWVFIHSCRFLYAWLGLIPPDFI